MKTLNCLFCGESLTKQDVDAELGLYIGWCEKHNWMEAEYWVTKDNQDVLEEFEKYESRGWDDSCNSTDFEEKVEDIYCPLCGELVSLLRTTSLDSIDKWDSYTFECPSHGVFKMKVECYSVWCEEDGNERLYSI